MTNKKFRKKTCTNNVTHLCKVTYKTIKRPLANSADPDQTAQNPASDHVYTVSVSQIDVFLTNRNLYKTDTP